MTRALAACLLLATAACGNAGAAPADAIARGEEALAAGQARTARIEFLNAIKGDPNNARLRLLQAEAYLALKDGAAAEAELRRARTLGTSPAASAHLLAHAYLLQGRNDDAVTESVTAARSHAAYAGRIRGQALMASGDVAAAATAFDAAAEAAPRDPDVWMDTARFRRSVGDMAGALAASNQAITLGPADPRALTLRGELTRGQYGLVAALPWFERALEIDPDDVPARLERAATLGDMGRTGEMLAETRAVLETAPDHPVAYYLQAMLAARSRKFALARTLYAKTGGALDAQPAAMLLAGTIELQTGAVEQAVGRLERLLGMQPDNRKARRLLAAAYWKRGDAAATIRTLQPIAERGGADSYALALLSKAYAKTGDKARAAQLRTRAARAQGVAGDALLASDMSDAQFGRLLRVAEDSPEDARAQVLLIGALLARGERDDALARARRLQADHPGAADAHVLVGDALGARGDYADAAAAYRRAANLSFSEPVAMRLIDALRRSRQDPAAARALELFLVQNPRNVPALLLAANGFMEMRDWGPAIAIYEGLRARLGDRDAALLNNLAYAYGQGGAFDRAIPLARKAWALNRDNPATADTLGCLLFKSGKDRARGLAMMARSSRGAAS